jgi:hypothetical protein
MINGRQRLWRIEETRSLQSSRQRLRLTTGCSGRRSRAAAEPGALYGRPTRQRLGQRSVSTDGAAWASSTRPQLSWNVSKGGLWLAASDWKAMRAAPPRTIQLEVRPKASGEGLGWAVPSQRAVPRGHPAAVAGRPHQARDLVGSVLEDPPGSAPPHAGQAEQSRMNSVNATTKESGDRWSGLKPRCREDAPTRPGASAGSGEPRGAVSKISPRLGSTPGDKRGLQGTRFAPEGNELPVG